MKLREKLVVTGFFSVLGGLILLGTWHGLKLDQNYSKIMQVKREACRSLGEPREFDGFGNYLCYNSVTKQATEPRR